MFKKKPEEYKCIAPGYIKLSDFVKKYCPELTDSQKKNKHDAIRKALPRVPNDIKAKASNRTYVLEKEFCMWYHVDYIEES